MTISNRLGSLVPALAGVLFLLYPVVRPYADETSMRGAEAFASNAWVASHLYIPQFFGTPALRMARGALIMAGFAWVAVEMWRKR